jgi:formylglycine-generating enzyme required for sulfatase activity
MGQGGNVWEWNETAYDGTNNTAGESLELRGCSWINGSGGLVASFRGSSDPTNENIYNGFRVASVPEPSALSLLAVGLGGLAILRRRREEE